MTESQKRPLVITDQIDDSSGTYYVHNDCYVALRDMSIFKRVFHNDTLKINLAEENHEDLEYLTDQLTDRVLCGDLTTHAEDVSTDLTGRHNNILLIYSPPILGLIDEILDEARAYREKQGHPGW